VANRINRNNQTNRINLVMNDLLKNPFFVFLAGLIALWLAFKVLKIFISLFWLFVLAFVVLFIINARFRVLVRNFFRSILR
jgi:hypothetical protein